MKDGSASNKKTNAQENSRNLFSKIISLKYLTFFVLVANTIIFARQCAVMRDTLPVINTQADAAKIQAEAAKIQAKANRIQARAANQSARSARKSADAASAMVEDAQRPYVDLTDVTLVSKSGLVPDRTLSLIAQITNLSKAPAFAISGSLFYAVYAIFPDSAAPTPEPADPPPGAQLSLSAPNVQMSLDTFVHDGIIGIPALDVGKHRQHSFEINLFPEEAARIKAGRAALHIFGSIAYSNSHGRRIEHNICMRYERPGRIVSHRGPDLLRFLPCSIDAYGPKYDR